MSTSAPPPVILSPLPLPPVHKVQRIRLMTGPAGLRVLFSESGPETPPGPAPPLLIQSVEPATAANIVTSHFKIRRLLHGTPEWDVAPGQGQPLRVVVASFGGAINSLSVLAGESEQRLIPMSEFYDLGDPRFVRGAPAPGVTALHQDQVVLFGAEPSGVFAPARPVLSGGDNDRALLLGTGGGWTLLVRRFEVGPKHAGCFPGILTAHPLGPDLKPVGAGFPVFGDDRIFPFDADVTPDGIAVLAVTAQGFALARLGAGQPPRVDHQPHPAPLETVSLLADGAILHMSFLVPGGGILLGSIPP